MAPAEILIVEDDSDIRESLCDFLTYEGYHVHTVENGEEGFNYLSRNAQSALPKLVFLDLMMPVMDGGTMLLKLKEELPNVTVPVVILSATVNKQISHNVVAYMKKPVDLDDLMIHVKKFSPKNS